MNPFDRFGLSPNATVDEITAELRERAEDASEEERRDLRLAWEHLTMHPRARLKLALTTFPASSEHAPAPPPRSSTNPTASELRPTLVDILPRPSVEAAFAGPHPPFPSVLPSIAEDRLLLGGSSFEPKTRKRENA